MPGTPCAIGTCWDVTSWADTAWECGSWAAAAVAPAGYYSGAYSYLALGRWGFIPAPLPEFGPLAYFLYLPTTGFTAEPDAGGFLYEAR